MNKPEFTSEQVEFLESKLHEIMLAAGVRRLELRTDILSYVKQCLLELLSTLRSNKMMKITIKRPCSALPIAEYSKEEPNSSVAIVLNPETEVLYIAHLPGGNIKIAAADGEVYVIDPRATKELG